MCEKWFKSLIHGQQGGQWNGLYFNGMRNETIKKEIKAETFLK